VQLAELIAPAKPQPRFGGDYRMPVIFAGNHAAASAIRDVLDQSTELSVVDNVRPTLEVENLSPARNAIHDLFLEHVMAHAPGYDKLISWADAPIMPTPGAVGDILKTIADREKINAVGVDIGGATTDVFSVFHGVFNRTVSANLGMSYSISNVCAETGLENILRWMPTEIDERELRNRIKNKMIRPTTIPQTLEALIFEQAVAREALRLAYLQHRRFATTLLGAQQQRTVGDMFAQDVGGRSIVDNMALNLLVGSGGVLSHAPRMEQTALMMIDAFEPEGVTRLAKDSIFMMPHLGVLAQVHPRAALEVFERDCLIYLGTCIAPKGSARPEQPICRYTLEMRGRRDSGQILFGDLQRIPLGVAETAVVVLQPAHQFDVGAGPGRALEAEVHGGTVGLVLDGRGRPLKLPSDHASRKQQMQRWVQAMQVYE
jgi:hypothetical protein